MFWASYIVVTMRKITARARSEIFVCRLPRRSEQETSGPDGEGGGGAAAVVGEICGEQYIC